MQEGKQNHSSLGIVRTRPTIRAANLFPQRDVRELESLLGKYRERFRELES
jgi:hypothetical protein